MSHHAECMLVEN